MRDFKHKSRLELLTWKYEIHEVDRQSIECFESMKHLKPQTMNRTIKFRGLRSNGEWVYGYYLKSSSGDTYIRDESDFLTYVVGESTVGQFTGLTDKNGKEIYEGDKNQDGAIVYWDSNMASLLMDYHNNEVVPFEGDEALWFEITGNIHENKKDDSSK